MLRVARTQACRIAGTGVAFPGEPRTNREVVARHAAEGRRGRRSEEELDDLAVTLGETLGVELRHWTHEPGTAFDDAELTSADLAADALSAALRDARMAPSDLGAIVCATSTPARVTSANGPAVAHRVGARCAAFDVRSGCAGGLLAFVQGCTLAAASGQPVAVLGADTFSKIAPPGEALAALAFGDAAAAAILVPRDEDATSGLASAVFASDGSLGRLASAPLPFPPTAAHLEAGMGFLQGDVEELAKRSPALYAEAAAEALRLARIDATGVDTFVPHQTSRPAIEAAARAAGVDAARTVFTVGGHGNCGAGGVLIALDRARRDGRAKGGTTLLLAALGGGLSWGAAVFRC